jgi:methylenetetrahydrofolate dehydrogenase (NADP+)/methenyltetrahydrofolate cyclohydrolase
MDIFDGNALARTKKQALKKRVAVLLAQGIQPRIAAILYTGDAGSELYTDIKQKMAQELGIEYQKHSFSLRDGIEPTLALLKELNADPTVSGIIIQKPTRKSWAHENHLEGKPKDIKKAYDLWWRLQTTQIAEEKDVDGLHPSILTLISEGKLEESKRVLPATARAVLEIFKAEKMTLENTKIAILGKSDLLGLPLYFHFLSKNYDVHNLGRSDVDDRTKKELYLQDFDVVITATGVKSLVTKEMVKDGVVVIDVGEPKGDVDFDEVKHKASFITPVPGGVGPMTVVCLMENCIDLIG